MSEGNRHNQKWWKRKKRVIAHNYPLLREIFTYSYAFLFLLSTAILILNWYPVPNTGAARYSLLCGILPFVLRVGFSCVFLWREKTPGEEACRWFAYRLPVICSILNSIFLFVCCLIWNSSELLYLLRAGLLCLLIDAVSYAHHCPSEKNPYLTLFLKLICLAVWGFLFMQLLHHEYVEGVSKSVLNSIWSFVFQQAFPLKGGILPALPFSMNNIITFFTGCLVFINWAYKRPCENWNPYSARSLNLGWNYFSFAITLFTASIYAFSMKMNRLPILLSLLLLATDICIYFLCNGQGQDETVRAAIIRRKIKPSVLVSSVSAFPGIYFPPGRARDEDRHKKMADALFDYARVVADISRTNLKNSGDPDKEVKNLREFIMDLINMALSEPLNPKDFDQRNVLYTLGFIFGYVLIPTKTPREITAGAVQIYRENIRSYLSKEDEDNNSFMNMFLTWLEHGMDIAEWRRDQYQHVPKAGNRRKYQNNDTGKRNAKMSALTKKDESGREPDTSEFFIWLQKGIKNNQWDTNKWEWMKRIEKELSI